MNFKSIKARFVSIFFGKKSEPVSKERADQAPPIVENRRPPPVPKRMGPTRFQIEFEKELARELARRKAKAMANEQEQSAWNA